MIARGQGRVRRARTVALLCVVGALLGGCRAKRVPAGDAAGATGTAIAADTLRGIVQLVGTEPGVVTLVGAGAGSAPLAVLVDGDAALREAAGLEVMVRGARRGTSDALPRPTPAFAVREFRVRAVDGTAAVDGTLAREGDRLVLRLADGGRMPLAAPPAALRELVGARIYWAGPFDRAPVSYGVLAR